MNRLAICARTGKILLRSALGGPVGGGVVTYNARGVQNLAIVSGFVGVYNSIAPRIGSRNTTVGIRRSQSSVSEETDQQLRGQSLHENDSGEYGSVYAARNRFFSSQGCGAPGMFR